MRINSSTNCIARRRVLHYAFSGSIERNSLMHNALKLAHPQEDIQVPNPEAAGGWHNLVEDAEGAFAQLGDSFGFKAFAILDISKRFNGRVLPSIELTNLVPAFLSCIEDEGPLGECSLFRVLEQTCRPFSWQTGVNAFTGLIESSDAPAGDKQFDELLDAFGIEGGLCVPVHDPRGKRSVVIYFGKDLGGAEQREQLIVESIRLFDSSTRYMVQRTEAKGPLLNARQVECLFLAAKGASNYQIAQHLDVSEHLVGAFLDSINEKLGTKTTSQAIAKAVELNIFSI